VASVQALAQQTNVDWDRSVADFSQCKTYARVKPVGPPRNP
jgi:hypothetical protein